MGVRAGQGYGSRKPKRRECPKCGKCGVTQWRAIPGAQVRYCQYCQASWDVAGWEAAAGITDPVIEPHFERFLVSGLSSGMPFGSLLNHERNAFYAGYRAALARVGGAA